MGVVRFKSGGGGQEREREREREKREKGREIRTAVWSLLLSSPLSSSEPHKTNPGYGWHGCACARVVLQGETKKIRAYI